MSDDKQLHNGSTGDAINERLRRIRFRTSREHSRFVDEIRLISPKLVLTVIVLFIAAQVVGLTVMTFEEGIPWPQLGYRLNLLAMAGIITAASIPVASLILLIGYVYRDAKRRGMSASLWTILVIVLLPVYLGIGFILYFLLREPLPYPCPACGKTVSARFNFCPGCKFNLRPACPGCRREVRLEDRFCPHCSLELAGGRATLQKSGAAPNAELGAAS